MKYRHHSLKFVKLVKLQDLDSLKNVMRIHQGLRSQLNNVISKHSKMPPRNTKCVDKMRKQRLLRWWGIFLAVFSSYPFKEKKSWYGRSGLLPTDTSSLCYTDGTILKSSKAKLLTELESRVKSQAPTKIDAATVDGMFLLHLLVDLPKTFK